MGRPISTYYSNLYPSTKFWKGETVADMRFRSNSYEWWNWYAGSTPLAIDVRIDHKSFEVVKEYSTIIDTQRIYNTKKEKDTITVAFNSDLSTQCVITVKSGEKLTSGVKTYIDFPFADSDGKLSNKGKRLSDSSNGETIKKDWRFDAEVDVTLPASFALDVQLTSPALQIKSTYEAVIVYDDGNMQQSKGLIVCDIEIPKYSVEYVLL